MAKSYATIGNTGRGYTMYVWVSADEVSNNGTYSTFIVRGGLGIDLHGASGSSSSEVNEINLNGRQVISPGYRAWSGEEEWDSFYATVNHGPGGGSGSASFSCWGYTSYPSGDATASVTVWTGENPRHTVWYNANGGSGAPGSQTKVYGYILRLSDGRPYREGYNFQGWSINNNGHVDYAPGSLFGEDADRTMWAVWNEITYNVAFDDNGGHSGPGSQAKYYTRNLQISSTTPQRDKYIFLGWSRSPTGSVEFHPGDTYSSNSNLTLYAVWKLAYNKPTLDYTISKDQVDKSLSVTVKWSVDTAWNPDNNAKEIYGQYDAYTNGVSAEPDWKFSDHVQISGTSGTTTFVLGRGLDLDFSYRVRVTIIDLGEGAYLDKIIQGNKYAIDVAPIGTGESLNFRVGINAPASKDAGLTVQDGINSIGPIFINGTNIYDLIYPIGSIYQSISAKDPSELFGGKWERLNDTFLFATNDQSQVGSKGGMKQKSLRAAIGAVKSNIGSLGYVAFPVSKWQSHTAPTYATLGSSEVNLSPSDWNHSVPVTDVNDDQLDVNIMPPYMKVNMWIRTG